MIKHLLVAGVVVLGSCGQPHPDRPAAPAIDRAAMAERVREEMRHAWSGYVKYAWGHDELKPVTHTAHDWHAAPLLMTPVDALDTLVMMGLTPEADAARKLIDDTLSFDHDITVKNFEITIS